MSFFSRLGRASYQLTKKCNATRYLNNFASLSEAISVPRTEVSTLQNGFRVASEDWNSLTCTVGLWVDVGSRYETDTNNGVAHFLEHMAFKGTQTRSQHDIELEVENKGGQLNAYTSREMTVFYAKCIAKDLPWAIELLADITKNSKFEDSQIERERSVILREMQEVSTNYQEVVFDYLHESAYRGTPLGRTILGPTENVQSLKRSDLTGFVDTFYKAPRMVLCATGSIDHNELVKLADKHFGSIPSNFPKNATKLTRCAYAGNDIRDRDDSMPTAHIAMALEGPGWASPETIPLMVASSLHGSWDRTHGGGFNVASRLASTCFNEKLIHSYQNFFTCYHDTSLWGIYFTSERKDMDRTINVIQEEWKHMCFNVTEQEVQRAKNMLKTNLILQLDGTTPVCEELGRHMLCYGRRIPITELLARVEAVNSKVLMDTCSKYIVGKSPAVASIGPIESLPDYSKIRAGMNFK